MIKSTSQHKQAREGPRQAINNQDQLCASNICDYGGRNDGKSIIKEVEMNLYDAHSPGRLFSTGIPRSNPEYKRGTSIQETKSKG